jgi:hypothetical protein
MVRREGRVKEGSERRPSSILSSQFLIVNSQFPTTLPDNFWRGWRGIQNLELRIES